MKQLLRKSLPLTVLALSMQSALAQEVAPEIPTGIVANPCLPLPVMTENVRTLLTELFMEPHSLTQADFSRLMGSAEFSSYNAGNQRMGNSDWPGLCRFRAGNTRLQTAGITPRIVFMGDSITENWLLGDPTLFSDMQVNRGIGGQTAPQMLARFRADVVALQPGSVHIMAGTNDIAGNTGPSTMQDFRNNIMSMAELAHAHGIAVILASVPPAAGFTWQPAIDPVPQIRDMNTWLQQYAAQNGFGYIDYYSALVGSKRELRAELGNDGVHPNRDGYSIMRRLLDQQLAAPAQ